MMKNKLYYILIAAVVIGIFGALAYKLKQNKAIAEERVFHEDPPPVSVDTHTPAPATGRLLFSGVFEPFRETKISAEIQGKINQITVDAGHVVAKGQTLVQLDQALLQWQLQAVEVQIEGLTADVNRYTILAKADAVQAVQLEKALLGLKAAQVQRASVEEQLRKTTIHAPFDGVVFSKLNEVGGFAMPGVPLLHLLDIGQLKFTINVPETDLKYFKMGQTFDITADAFPDKKLQGRVSMIAGKANVGNSFAVQLMVKNFSNHAIRAGMFGQITVSNQN